MASLASSRIKKELKELLESAKTNSSLVNIEMNADNFMHLTGTIMGPPDTPYENAKYRLQIDIPDNYPFCPPVVRFINKIWHPNISSVTGVICLDILKNQWAAAMSLRTILLSIQALLGDPEPNDPQDAVVANQYKSNPDMFHRTAKHWAKIYAEGPTHDEELDDKVKKIVSMGFQEEDARAALSMKDWDIMKAAEHLIT